jgi:hypothetical protein
MRRIENSVREERRTGYARNAFGDYYREAGFQKVLALVLEAEELSHLDGATRFSRAGFLSWAGLFEAAVAEYLTVIAEWPNYAQPARSGLAIAYGRMGRIADAQRVIDEHNAVLAASPGSGGWPLDPAKVGATG